MTSGKPDMFECTVAGAVIAAVTRQAVKLSASKNSKWSRPTTVNVEGQFTLPANDTVVKYLHQVEHETR